MDNPITREEMYLAAAAGERLNLPEPITRVEHYLKRIAERYGGGTGTGGNAVQYVPQVLTPEQKAQARANIGATAVKVNLDSGVLSIE